MKIKAQEKITISKGNYDKLVRDNKYLREVCSQFTADVLWGIEESKTGAYIVCNQKRAQRLIQLALKFKVII